MRSEKLTEKNVKSKFEKRVDAAVRAVNAIGKCRPWEKSFGLPKESITKALDHLMKTIEGVRSGTGTGFRL